MICHICGKACATRSDGRRAVLADKALFFCNTCAPTDVSEPLGGRSERTGAFVLAEGPGAIRLADCARP
jgi:hypothetical protein